MASSKFALTQSWLVIKLIIFLNILFKLFLPLKKKEHFFIKSWIRMESIAQNYLNSVCSLILPSTKMLFVLSVFQRWEFSRIFCFVFKRGKHSVSTICSILTSSSSKRPVPPLKRPPLEPNGVKSSSVSLGGLKMSSSSSRKYKSHELW